MKNLMALRILPSLLVALTLFCFSCGNEDAGPGGNLPDPIVEQGSLEDYETMSIELGLSMFQDVVATGEENVLISPYSLQSALQMTMHGAAGETREEFRTALNTGDFLSDGLGTYYNELAVKLRPAADNTSFDSQNRVFYYPEFFTPYDTYKNEIESYYKGNFAAEDFSDAGTVDVINGWVDEVTEGRIDKVLEEIRPDEAIFLINALVFTTDWGLGFDPVLTRDRFFTTEDGSEIEVPTMSSGDNRPYMVTEDFSAVDIPVKDEDYAVTFILPSEDAQLDDFVEAFDIDHYRNINDNLQPGRVQVFLPKFELATSKNMKDILVDRGMATSFTGADLSNMGEFAANPFLSRVLHDVFIKVDEKGVEGAAVTTVGVGITSVPPTITFNKPFVFAVRHVETQVPLFIGKVGNPDA